LLCVSVCAFSVQMITDISAWALSGREHDVEYSIQTHAEAHVELKLNIFST